MGENCTTPEGQKVKGCSHCGRKDHVGSDEERKSRCPAFDKQCKKCGRTGNFQVKCLSKSGKQVKAETKEVATSEAPSVDSISVGEAAGLMMVVASINHAIKKQSKTRSTLKIPYMVYDNLTVIYAALFY